MAIEDVLATIAASLGTGADMWQRKRLDDADRAERDDARRIRDEDRQIRIGEIEHRRGRERREDAQRTSDRAEAAMKDAEAKHKSEAELQAQRAFADSLPDGPIKQAALAIVNKVQVPYGAFKDVAEKQETDNRHNTVEGTLPAHVRGAYHASGHTQTYTPDQLLTDDERFARKGKDLKQSRDSSIAEYDAKQGIEHRYAAIPVTPKDDPALPAGVRQWLAALPTQNGNDYNATMQALRDGWAQQVAAHPRVDATKAKAYVEGLFGEAQIPVPPARARQDTMLDAFSRPGAIPVVPRQPAAPGPQPNGAPSAAAPAPQPNQPGGLEAQAATLLAQYRAEQDPVKKAAVWAQLQALKRAARGSNVTVFGSQ